MLVHEMLMDLLRCSTREIKGDLFRDVCMTFLYLVVCFKVVLFLSFWNETFFILWWFSLFSLSLPFTVPIKYKVLAKSTFRVKSSQSERVFLCHVETRRAVYLRL